MTVITLSETISAVTTARVIHTTPRWKETAARRRQEIDGAIPKEYLLNPTALQEHNLALLAYTCGLLSAREQSIIALSATELLKLIHDRTYTAVEVTTAFCKSAAVAHQATNCLAVVMFEKALNDAAALDKYMQETGRPKGPLHGLPISVKEHIYLAGTKSTSGFVAWADEVSETDALAIEILRNAGAVFHVKTTDPQGLMALETTSNLYGTTTNPYNKNLTPGGSSGGEGALIAMRGSLLGIGTDIGGSIRVPSGFCGIFGLKPSVARLPHGGLSGAHGGMENIVGCVGPMASCVEDMRLFCDILLAAQPWLKEPSLVEIPWKQTNPIPKPLKIGVIHHDGIVHPHPPITRHLQLTAAALDHAGHTIVPWTAASALHKELVDCIDAMYFLDGAAEYYDILHAGNEPASPLMEWLMTRPEVKSYSAAETWKLNQLRNKLQTEYARLWNESGVDAVLCPVNASVASVHGESTYWGYSSVWNILDYSAAVFPVGTVHVGKDTRENYPLTAATWMSEQDQIFDARYRPERYKNAPVSLQLVTRRFGEERLLDMVQTVVNAVEKQG